MSSFLYRRPRYLALTLLTIVALGLISLSTVGRQEDPTITNLFATIVTPYPGAEPERVEALVTEKIEAELRTIPEIDVIESTSRAGVSAVRVELSERLSRAEIDQAFSEVRDALSDAAARFPPGVPEPEFDDDRIGAYTALVAVTAEPGVEASPGLLSRIAEALQERLRRIPNTKLVERYGEAAEEARVTIDADALAALGLTPADVAAALAAADAKATAGRVRGAAADYIVEVAGAFEDLARIRETPVATGADGRVTRVADIAAVTRAARAPPDEIAYAGGRRAVLVAARMEDDLQVDRWAAQLRAAVADFARTTPLGIAVEQVFDQSRYTAARLTEVAGNLALGVALVVGVLFVTMGWRAAAIVALMLPLTSLLSLAALDRLGVTIHQMSVTGLIVALGLLVDAAIVTTDDIRRRLAEGAPRLAAVRGAVRRLAAPLLASTVTTVLAFVPMAALPGPSGDFVGAIALSVIVMLFASLLLALTVGAAIAGRLLPEGAAETPRWWRDGATLAPASRLFSASLGAALRWRRLALLAAATPALIGFLAFPTLTAQFFPGVERDQFHVQLDLGPGAAIAATEAAARRAEAILRADPAVERVQWVVGRSAPPFYYNMLENRDRDPGFAEALVTTGSPEATDAAIPRLQAALDHALPEARTLARGLKQGPPVNAPVEMRIVGPSLGTLRALGAKARRVMSEAPMVTHTEADLGRSAPKLVFEIDEDKARLAGLTLDAVARQLTEMGEGVVGGSLIEGPEELPVRVRLPAADRADAERLAALMIQPPGARAAAAAGDFPAIPLRALGAARLLPSDSRIARRNGERVNTIRAHVAHGVLPEEALRAIRRRLDAAPLALPQGYRIEWGGDSDARSEVVRNLMSVVGVVVIGSLAAVLLTFNSWRLTAVTFVVAGLSIGLSLLAIEIFRYPFGVNALIGVIGSVGVSINAAIIILTALQADPEAALGDPEAIRGVVMRQGRHIVSTTVTTFGGFLPLILGGGGFWPPFAMAIAGGVLLSTVVSFWFTPPAFSLVTGLLRSPAAGAPRYVEFAAA